MSGLCLFTWPLPFSLSKGIYTLSGTSHAYLDSHWSPCCFHLNLTLKQHLLAETLSLLAFAVQCSLGSPSSHPQLYIPGSKI